MSRNRETDPDKIHAEILEEVTSISKRKNNSVALITIISAVTLARLARLEANLNRLANFMDIEDERDKR